jgi:uncharacterized integral membrane protein
MAEQQHPRERPREGNGGPVTPGTEPSVPLSGNGSNGAPAPTGAGGGAVAAPESDKKRKPTPITRTRVSGLWIGVILSVVVLIFLLIFILQNLTTVPIYYLGAQGSLPAGVALLFAAILGALVVAVPGALRIFQLRREARRRGMR